MDIFTRFKQALKIREVLVDNHVFQLHYRVTALLLLCCAGLVASKQHFGDPIDCITRDDVPNKIMDTYCWIHSTFTLPGACNKTVGTEVAHPCVDKYSHNVNEERMYHKYYQWVYFVLFFQAAFFYAPHFFWKGNEAKLLACLTSGLRDPLFKESEKAEQAVSVVTYLKRHRSRHQQYYYLFTLFELCNFLNVLIQMYVLDQFLGGTFTTYGLDVINYSQQEQYDRVDPMVRVFPRMTKCSFHRFGPSGDVQRYDALCILPLNIINEKIYIIMWFWFVFLAAVTGFWLIYRALTFFKPSIRYKFLKRRASLVEDKHLKTVLKWSQSGDWFLLCMMCKNMDSQWFKFVMEQYSDMLKRDEILSRQRNGSGGGGGSIGNSYNMGGRRSKYNSKTADATKELMLNEDDYNQSGSDTDLEQSSSSSVVEFDEANVADHGKKSSTKPRHRDTFDGVAVVENAPPSKEVPAAIRKA